MSSLLDERVKNTGVNHTNWSERINYEYSYPNFADIQYIKENILKFREL
jgi:hypothetical protein